MASHGFDLEDISTRPQGEHSDSLVFHTELEPTELAAAACVLEGEVSRHRARLAGAEGPAAYR